MKPTLENRNKAIVLEAFDTLFNRHHYAAAEKFWSPDYIQYSAHIEPGREGLFNLVKNSPASLKYELGIVVADGDYVNLHGRFSGMGQPVNWIVADILRLENGLLSEHWDVIQDEASPKSGLPMSLIALPKAARIWPRPSQMPPAVAAVSVVGVRQ